MLRQSIDDMVAGVVATIDELELAQRTYIAFTSDHVIRTRLHVIRLRTSSLPGTVRRVTTSGSSAFLTRRLNPMSARASEWVYCPR